VAHLRDGYVDFYLRGEDDDIPLTEWGIQAAVVATTAVFLGCVALLWLWVGWLAVALTAPLYVLAILHAPYLDRHPLSVTIDYPTGIALTLLGGFVVQAESLTRTIIVVALAHLLVLAGIKVLLDGLDRDADRRIDKRTIPVVLGPARARFASTVLVASAGVTLALGVGAGLLPPVALAVAAVPLGASLIGHRTSLHRATGLVMSATYPFTAGIVVVVRPGLL
jgi:1,4-dihydroxy-2-naphthoate octaprenyltransferase